ncbi:MAG: hypothetical protein Q7S21_00150 [archaeon]|nr:hypothetical protein [archaeon]
MLGFVLLFSLFALPAQAITISKDLSTYQQAIVLTDCSDYSCLKEIVQGARDSNQLVSIVFPQYNSFIALIEPGKSASLKQKFSKISSIEFESISDSKISSLNDSQKFSANVWNNLKADLVKEDSSQETFNYNDSLMMPEAVRESDASQSIIGGGNEINWASNSVYTSEYMIGDVTVAVLMPESNASSPNTENWTTQEVTDVTAEVTEGLNWWITQYNLRGLNSNLHLTFNILVFDPFNYPTQVSTNYETIELTMGNSLPMNEIFANFGFTGSTTNYGRYYAFVNNLRNTYLSEWTFIIEAVDSTIGGDFSGGGTAGARLGGPYWVGSMTFSTLLPNVNLTASHETGHIFWADDQYTGSCTCTQTSGYLNIENQNCDATPVCVTDVPSVMRGGISGIDQYGSWQIGWKDSDVDNIPDVLDYGLPTASLNAYTPNPTTNKTLNYSGSGSVGPAVNNANPYHSGTGQDILISDVYVSNGFYRVDNGSWNSSVIASDGLFEEQVEACGFTTFSLPNGNHSIELKIKDSLGQETISAPDNVTILGAVGESCLLNADCLSNVCRSGNGSGKYCVSSTTNCAVSGGEVVSGTNFSRNVVNRLDNSAICYQGFWGEDPLLASPPSTFKEVLLSPGFTNTTVSIELPKMAPVTNAIWFVSNNTQSPVNDVIIDVGNDGIDAKSLGTISENNSPRSVDFSTELNDAIQNCALPNTLSRGICTIKIGISSSNSGTIVLHGLDVQYNKWLPVEGVGGQGAGFMPSYTYLQDVIIGSTHPAITTDNTFTITLNTASLISAGKLQADCDDLRVFDTVSQIELDKDIQNCNSSNTSVSWSANQALSADVADSTTYDLYYGNTLADSSLRTLSNVYKLYDDFNDGSISGTWNAISGASESGGSMNIVVSSGAVSGAIATGTNVPFNSFIEARVKSSTNQESGYFGLNAQTNPTIGYDGSNAGLFQLTGAWTQGTIEGYVNNSPTGVIDSYVGDTYKNYKTELTQTQTKLYSDDGSGYVLKATKSSSTSENTIHPYFTLFCAVNGCTNSTETLSIDWVKVVFYVPSTDVSLGGESLNAPANAVPIMDEVNDITWVAQDRVSGPMQFLFGATDADGDDLTYSNSYNLTNNFTTTDWVNWNTGFTSMNWSGEPYNIWIYGNLMYSSNADAGLYYVIARVSDGTATIGQIVEINLLPNNSRPPGPRFPVRLACDTGQCPEN